MNAFRDPLFRNIVEGFPMRVFWKDIDSRYLGCNSLFAMDAGLANPDDLVGKTDFEMGWKDQAERYVADDRVVMTSGIPRLGHEEPLTTGEGRIIWIRTSKVPLLKRYGCTEVQGYLFSRPIPAEEFVSRQLAGFS